MEQDTMTQAERIDGKAFAEKLRGQVAQVAASFKARAGRKAGGKSGGKGAKSAAHPVKAARKTARAGSAKSAEARKRR